MTHSDKPNLSSLYRQRRAQHPVPESLVNKIRRRYRQRAGLRFRWITLAPTLASAALVIIIIRPWMNPEPAYEENVMPSETVSSTMTGQQAPSAPQVEQIAQPAAREPDLRIKQAGESETLKTAPPKQTFSAAAADAPAAQEKPMTIPAAQPGDYAERVFLLVQDPANHIGINCEGELTALTELSDKQAGEWVSVQWVDPQWVIEKSEANPCPR